MLTFEWYWLFLLLPLPFVIKPKKNEQDSGGHLMLPGSSGSSNISITKKSNSSRLIYWLIWILLVTASARPLWVGDTIDLPTKGRDLMLSVDLSGSMQIEDMVINGQAVDRFTLVQHVLSDFIERRKGDRLGLILFADHAYLQSPLTQDRHTVAQFLKEAQIGLVGKQTAIGESIALATKRFDKIDQSNRVLILLTDGANNSGSISPEKAAEIAAKRHITIYTIGVGADVMERRTFFGKEKINPSGDLDEGQLKSIAKITGGKYFRARNTEDLKSIYQEIDKLEPISREQLSYRPQKELFFWPLSIALLLSTLMAMSTLPMFNQYLSTRGKK